MPGLRGVRVVILFVGILPFISTLLGGWAAFRLQHRLHTVMAFAAGILVATALVDLLPEAIELIGTDRAPLLAGGAAVIGFLVYASVEAFIHQASYEHRHGVGHDPHDLEDHDGSPAKRSPSRTKLGWIAPAGLIAHSTLDGVAIGLGFEAGTEVGVIVALAVLVHDFADGLNIVTVAFAGGRGRGSALILLALDAAATIVGIALSQVIGLTPLQLGVLLGGFGGAFIAIGGVHLLPEAQHRGTRASPLVLLTVTGAALVVLVRVALI